MRAASSPQTSQRVRVGVIGLAIVVVMIALAAAILGSASRERPVLAPGAAKPDTVANLAVANGAAGAEALSDMGVSPGVKNQSAPAK